MYIVLRKIKGSNISETLLLCPTVPRDAQGFPTINGSQVERNTVLLEE